MATRKRPSTPEDKPQVHKEEEEEERRRRMLEEERQWWLEESEYAGIVLGKEWTTERLKWLAAGGEGTPWNEGQWNVILGWVLARKRYNLCPSCGKEATIKERTGKLSCPCGAEYADGFALLQKGYSFKPTEADEAIRETLGKLLAERFMDQSLTNTFRN